ncbi:TetR/AcrR family transcriptional regulator [Pseudonocardia sp. GCM10023141]|uniref:TetR/AcrR family transcriptional regulator n=1 Tax=Pseudonocardia sp. GCM10023141 TaxID=3252653 RepID=UPI00361EACDB
MTDAPEPPGDLDAPAVAAKGGRPRDPALDDAIIEATRQRLVRDGYSTMTIGEIAADAGVSRPTIYRRWPGKLELTIDALDYGFRAQRESYPDAGLEELPPRAAFTEAVRRVDPCYFNPDAMVLMGNFMGETIRTPELLAIVVEHAVEPRVRLIERLLDDLRARGAVRADIDTHTIATLCFGSYYAAFLRAEHDRSGLAEQVVAVLWPGITAT